MQLFVPPPSIVRKIWGRADVVLVIFAGAAAEFALNKAADWLYFTGRLPADPLGRLFSTVSYARRIIFSPEEQALQAIDQMRSIHTAVEQARSSAIPDWAYRDVLYMLIHYSIAAYELLQQPLTAEEKEETTAVFIRVGNRMGIPGLPCNYTDWKAAYTLQQQNLAQSKYTIDLFQQYRKHLGRFRYQLLLAVQQLVVHPSLHALLPMPARNRLKAWLPLYRASRYFRADRLLQKLLVPPLYRKQVQALNQS